MLLAQLYYILGWICLVAGAVGIVGTFAINLPYLLESIGCLFVGIITLGLAEACDAIGRISEHTKKTAALLELIRDALSNTDRLRSEEAISIRDLLVKVAISAPSIGLIGPSTIPEKTVTFHYSNEDMTTRGPFSIETMRAMIRDGVIRAETPVAVTGSQDWLTYPAFPELV